MSTTEPEAPAQPEMVDPEIWARILRATGGMPYGGMVHHALPYSHRHGRPVTLPAAGGLEAVALYLEELKGILEGVAERGQANQTELHRLQELHRGAGGLLAELLQAAAS